MGDNTDDDTANTSSDPLEATGAEPLTHASTTVKLLGELAADDGTGVIGHNTATSGVAIGVQGVTDSGEGYGLSTPDDAQVGGAAELAALAGSLTGGTEVTDIAGDGLTVDGSGALGWSVTSEKRGLTSSGSTWTPISGLSGETPVEVTVGTPDLEGGKISLEVDGTAVTDVTQGETLHRIVGATSSVSLVTDEYFSFAGSYSDFNSSFPSSGAIKPDGTKLFATGGSGQSFRFIKSYTLSTPWEIQSASSTGNVHDISTQIDYPGALRFKDDGTKLFVVGRTADTVYSYVLSSPWDLTSASYNTSLDVSGEASGPESLAFRDDGSEAYVSDGSTDSVYSYTFNTNWDLDTASYSGDSFDVSGQADRPDGIAFEDDGTTMFVLSGSSDDRVYWYTLSTPWDITSASFVDSLDVTDEKSGSTALAAKGDGTQLFLFERDTAAYQYDEIYSGVAHASVKTE